MVFVNLEKKAVEEVKVDARFEEGKTIEIESKYTFGVEYTVDNSKCVGHLEQTLREKSETPSMSFSIKMNGFCSCEDIKDEDDKKEAHIQVYNQLFPYMQALYSNIMTGLGFPPIIIPRAKLRPEDTLLRNKKEK